MPEPLTIHVLIIDDDRAFRDPLKDYLERQAGDTQFRVVALASAAKALSLGEQVRRFDVALIDQSLVGDPPMTGTDLMVQLKTRAENLEVVIITGWGVEVDTGIEAIRHGAYRYFAKGGSHVEIPLLIRAAYERRRLMKEYAETLKAVEAERRRANEMGTLNEIGRIIAAAPSLDELPRLIYRETSRVLDTTNFFIAYYDEAAHENDFRLLYERGREVEPVRLGIERGLSGWVVRTRQPLLLRNGTREFREQEGIEMVPPEAKSWLGVPILSRERVLGIIGAQDYELFGKFDENHMQLLQVIASFAATAIENARTMALLRQEQERYKRLITDSFDGVIAIDLEGRIIEYNPAAGQILGYGRDEILGQSIAIVYHNIAAAQRINYWLHNNLDHRVTGERVDVIAKNGEVIPVELSASLLLGDDDQPTGSVGYFEDLRHSKLLEARLQDLLEAAKSIVSLHEPDRLAKLILQTARRAIPNAVKGTLHQFDPEANMLVPWVSDGYQDPIIFEIARFAPGEGVAGRVFQDRNPLRIDDGACDERVKQLPPPAFHSGALICAPLVYKDEVLGTLSLDNPDQQNAFIDDDLRLLKDYADLAAIALANARQYERRAQELHAVQTVDGMLGYAALLDETLNLIVDVAWRRTHSRQAELYTLRARTSEPPLLILEASAPPTSAYNDDSFKLLRAEEEKLIGSLSNGEPVYDRLLGGYRYAVPLKNQQAKVIGVLALITDRTEGYDEEAQGLVNTLAQQAALAIQYEAQIRAFHEHERQLQERNLELEKAKQEIDAYGAVATMGMFGAEITHSLAQKAFALANLAATIRELFPKNRTVVELTKRIEDEAQRLSEFPLPLHAGTTDPTARSPVIVDEVLNQWVSDWCGKHPNIQLALDLKCRNAKVSINEELFRGALRKLVENALRAMSEKGGKFSVESRIRDRAVEILLRDTGPGIPERHRPRFLKGRIEKGEGESGMGMGAFMSLMVLRHYGGDVQLLPTDPPGTSILITLPLTNEAVSLYGVTQ